MKSLKKMIKRELINDLKHRDIDKSQLGYINILKFSITKTVYLGLSTS